MESMRLLQADITANNSRAIYLAVGESELFDNSQNAEDSAISYDSQSSSISVTVPLPLDEASTNVYGKALISAFRALPDLVVVEDCVNYPTVIRDEVTINPLDSMIIYSLGANSSAVVIEAKTVEESIRHLHGELNSLARKYLAETLMLAYMDGKRWVITPETVLLALID